MEVLHSLYPIIRTLKEFLLQLNSTGYLAQNLIKDTDNKSYKSLVENFIICALEDLPSDSSVKSFKQTSTQSEIVFSVIRKLKNKERSQRNLLSLGYEIGSDNPNAQVSATYSLESTHPNQNTGAVLKPAWRTLLSRIGDEAMVLLLETQSIFMPSSAGCYIQISGVAVFDLWRFEKALTIPVKSCYKPYPQGDFNCAQSETQSNYTQVQWKVQQLLTQAKKNKESPTQSTISPSDLYLCHKKDKLVMHKQLSPLRESELASMVECKSGKPVTQHNSEVDQLERVKKDLQTKPGKRKDIVKYLFPRKKRKVTHQKESKQLHGNHKRQQTESSEKDEENQSKKLCFEDCEQMATDSEHHLSCGKRESRKRRTRRRKTEKRKKNRLESSTAQTIRYHTPVERSKILYAKDLREKLPTKYILNSVPTDEEGAKQVLDYIISKSEWQPQCIIKSTEEGKVCIGDNTRCKLTELLMHIIEEHRKCPYRAILNNQAKKKPTNENHYSNVQVFRFLKTCLGLVLPDDLLGSSHNKNRFLKAVKRFVNLGRYEKLYLGEILQGVRAKDCLWLRREPNKEAVLAHVLYFLLSDHVGVLLKSFFYVTDTSTYRNKMFYIRKSTWSVLQKQTISGYEERGLFRALSRTEAENLLSTEEALGVCHMRFLPKSATAIRPISNLSRKPPINSGKTVSINKQLTEVFYALTLVKHIYPALLGTSKQGLDDIYTTWRKFVMDRRNANDHRPLYFVKLDLQSCYDSIDQKKLFEIIQGVASRVDENYTLRKYATVAPSGGELKRKFHLDVKRMSDYLPKFSQLVQKLTEHNNLHRAVVVDQVYHKEGNMANALEKLKAHLYCNVVQAGGHYYLQQQGICQGSVLSTLLCSFYYGAMERLYLPSPLEGVEVLMRQVDDFLYVTPHVTRAIRFANILLNGIPEFNCSVNEAKTLTNFPIPGHPLVMQLAENAWLPWCGILFNTRTLEVSVDYSRYKKINIGDTLSFDSGNKPGAALSYKILRWMRLKCHCLFLDSNVNSAKTVYRNIYELFLLSAARLHHCIVQLPSSHRTEINTQFFYRMILSMPPYLQHQATTKVKQLADEDAIQISLVEMTWLCLKAFSAKFNEKRAQYIRLLKGLEQTVKMFERKLNLQQLEEMKTAIEFSWSL